MTAKELTEKTINDIIKRRLQAKNEFYAYQRERNLKKFKNWSVRARGYRWS